VLGANAFDATLIFLGITGVAPSMAVPLQQAISKAYARYPGQLLSVAITAPEPMVREYEALGILTTEDPSRAVAALGALNWFRQSTTHRIATASIPACPELSLPTSGRFNEAEAKALLATIGIPSPREALTTTPEQAAMQAQVIGFPVAVKLVSADVLHKTEVGGVKLGLNSAAEVEDAVRAMQTGIARLRPDAQVDGFLISQMITGGAETILGVHRDPAFGPVVTFGLGGVLVELVQDTVCALAPVSLDEARAMIGRIKTAPLLTGYRGGPAHDVEALASAIVGVSAFAARHGDHLHSLEINPLRVMPGSGGVVALDAVIEMDPA
jgi:acetate---CoA ligase (ADP-forming)